MPLKEGAWWRAESRIGEGGLCDREEVEEGPEEVREGVRPREKGEGEEGRELEPGLGRPVELNLRGRSEGGDWIAEEYECEWVKKERNPLELVPFLELLG